MAFELPPLPYSMDALKPHLSAETLQYHHGKHHKAYVDKANELIKGTKFEKASLEEILKTAEPGPLFNNVEQHYNHSFYWKCMSPKGGGEANGPVADAIKKSFGHFDAFKKKFSEAAVSHFGSGWAWLVRAKDGSMQVVATPLPSSENIVRMISLFSFALMVTSLRFRCFRVLQQPNP